MATSDPTPEPSRFPLGMTLFLISDAMAWVGFFVTLLVLRGEADAAAGPGRMAFQAAWVPDLTEARAQPFALALLLPLPILLLALGRFCRCGGAKPALALPVIVLLAAAATHCGWSGLRALPQAGIHPDGIALPTLEAALKAEEGRPAPRSPEVVATELFGGRADEDASLPLTEANWLARPLQVQDPDLEDYRPRQPGLIHSSAYGIPATAEAAARPGTELYIERIELEGEEVAEAVAAERAAGARIASGFASIGYGLLGFHLLHLAAGTVGLSLLLVFSAVRRSAPSAAALHAWGLYFASLAIVELILSRL